MKLTREELITRIKERIGEGITDDDIALLEDVTDTYDELDALAKDNADWKAKYEENDAMWRKKYIDRFNGKVESDADFVEEPSDAEETILEYEAPKNYDDLFQVGEENG